MKDLVDGFFPDPIDHPLNEIVNTSGLNEDDALKMVLGSTEFTSTKGKQVKNNEKGKTAFTKVRKFRQVLKRKSNYNIPLTRQELEVRQKEQQQQLL